MSDSVLGIGEAAALYSLPPSTLRWWERQGVLSPPDRQGGRRVYRDVDLRRIGLAYLFAVNGEMALNRAAIVVSGKCDKETRRREIREQIGGLEERINEMTAARDYLVAMLRCDHDDPARCPQLDVELEHNTPRGGPRPAVPDRDEIPAADSVRDENPTTECHHCRGPVSRSPRGRPRAYCSATCRQRAYRARHTARRAATRR